MLNGKFKLFLEFNHGQIKDLIDDELKEIQEIVTNRDMYISCIETHRSIDAKRIVESLLTIDESLYIFIDDGSCWMGTGKEFINQSFDF